MSDSAYESTSDSVHNFGFSFSLCHQLQLLVKTFQEKSVKH
jgi:hypothetical protein